MTNGLQKEEKKNILNEVYKRCFEQYKTHSKPRPEEKLYTGRNRTPKWGSQKQKYYKTKHLHAGLYKQVYRYSVQVPSNLVNPEHGWHYEACRRADQHRPKDTRKHAQKV